MLLDGRKAIVTGASSGIGKATAERLGREGASVCVNYFSDKEADAAQQVVPPSSRKGSPGRSPYRPMWAARTMSKQWWPK